jgi:hypothetical protein
MGYRLMNHVAGGITAPLVADFCASDAGVNRTLHLRRSGEESQP